MGVIFQALAVFRFFSFAMGAGLVFFLNLGDEPPIGRGVLIGLVGLYNLARVLWRFNPSAHMMLANLLVLGSDVLLSITLVLMTDGLDSAFLIYSLAPILSASLLMGPSTAVVVAAITGLSVSGGHVLTGLGIGEFPSVLSGNYMAFSLLYLAVCLLIAYLPFIANLNWQRRVRAESMEIERSRLRREVHDNGAQTLAFLSLKVKRAEEGATSPGEYLKARDVNEIGSMVERAYLSVRDYLDEAQDEHVGEPLSTTLALAARQWSRDTGLPVQMSLAEADDGLTAKTKLQLLQIAREALANAAKHASPSQVWVELERESDGLSLRIRDDGKGISHTQPRGHGLDIMNERASVIGATLTVSSQPGEGTNVVVVCPADPREADQ